MWGLQAQLFEFRSASARAWLAQVDSNHRPRAYQARALTTWAMSQYFLVRTVWFHIDYLASKVFTNSFSARQPLSWWRWWDSNPWPPACRAGALPTELHPHILGSFPSKDPSKLNNGWKPLCPWPFLTINSFCWRRFSIERRWSSRTFRYGYLVTT